MFPPFVVIREVVFIGTMDAYNEVTVSKMEIVTFQINKAFHRIESRRDATPFLWIYPPYRRRYDSASALQ